MQKCRPAAPQPIVGIFIKSYPRSVDSDYDGYDDEDDCCPDLPEDFDGIDDEDGCPDCDDDGDGVPETGLLVYDAARRDARWLPGPGCELGDPAAVVQFPPPPR